MNVEQCMSRQPKSCSSNDSLAHAAQIMWENDCGYVPVIDGRNRVIGVITDRDICMAAYTKGAALNALPVSTAMAKKVYTCRPQDALEAAERLMQTYQVRRLPVVDGDERIVGVISLNDVARATRAALDLKVPEPQVQELARTLAAISEPRRRTDVAAAPAASFAAAPRPSTGSSRDGRAEVATKPASRNEPPAAKTGTRRQGSASPRARNHRRPE